MIDLRGVKEYSNWLKEAGEHILKVVEVKKDTTRNGNEVLKVEMVTKNNETFTADFVLTDGAKPFLVTFLKTIGIPLQFEPYWLINRYIVGVLEEENYQRNDGSIGTKLKVKYWKISKSNPKFDVNQVPIEQATQQESQAIQQAVNNNVIDENDIPF